VQDKELRRKLLQSMRGLVMWVNLMGMTAAIAAYRDGQEWLDQVLAYLEGNRDYLADYLATQLPRLKMVKPEGTYLAWIDCREAGLSGTVCEYFIKEARVGFNDGATFGKGGEGFVRLNFACTRTLLTQALGQMKASLQKLAN
jgi:cystathionine beta-lyase